MSTKDVEIERLKSLLREAIGYIPTGDERGNPNERELDFIRRVKAEIENVSELPFRLAMFPLNPDRRYAVMVSDDQNTWRRACSVRVASDNVMTFDRPVTGRWVAIADETPGIDSCIAEIEILTPVITGGAGGMSNTSKPGKIDRSEAADARRFRWLLQGNGYFMEEQFLCGRSCEPDDIEEHDNARHQIDAAMAREAATKKPGTP